MPRLTFGQNENGTACLGDGWSGPEVGFTWTLGDESSLEIPVEDPRGDDLYVEFTLTAFRFEPAHLTQRLAIDINGQRVAAETLQAESCLGFRLRAGSFPAAPRLHIRLHHPDAVCPHAIGLSADTRRLAFALHEIDVQCVPREPAFTPILRPKLPISNCAAAPGDHDMIRGVTGLELRELSLAIESLGLNCEFGFFQRRCGAEPLGFLRFAGLTYQGLIGGLDDGFAELDNPAQLACFIEQPGWDWMVRNSRYCLTYHTFLDDPALAPSDILARHAAGLRFRRGKFRDLLGSGEKLFMVNRPEGMSHAEALPLLTRLRRTGPNALLYISATTGQPPGSVEALGPHLFRGSMDGVNRIAPLTESAGRENWLSDAGMTSWISICAHAYRLWREHREF